MGQYYKAFDIETKQWISAHDYDNGLKLTEHSWIGNKFVGAVMSLMTPDGKWYKHPIVWAGDYYNEKEEFNYYEFAKESFKIKPLKIMSFEEQRKSILVNHTKKLYIRYDESPSGCGSWKGWYLNPLPLLTALGNGRGGGDYYQEYPNFKFVGTWAFDVLSIENTAPRGNGFRKFKHHFIEKVTVNN